MTTQHVPSVRSQMRSTKLLLEMGAATSVAFSLFLFSTSSWYLYEFMDTTNKSVENLLSEPEDGERDNQRRSESALLMRFAMARIAFNTCGLVVGLAVGFLAVALFLLGVQSSMGVEGISGDSKLGISQMTSGGFALLCSTVIVMTCVIVRPTLTFEGRGVAASTRSGSAPSSQSRDMEIDRPGSTVGEDEHGPLSKATIEAYELP